MFFFHSVHNGTYAEVIICRSQHIWCHKTLQNMVRRDKIKQKPNCATQDAVQPTTNGYTDIK